MSYFCARAVHEGRAVLLGSPASGGFAIPRAWLRPGEAGIEGAELLDALRRRRREM